LGHAAATHDRKRAVQTQSYGSEARGGAARSEVVIADESIDYPKVISADILIAMSQEAFNKHVRDAKPSAIVLVDSNSVPDLPERHDMHLYKVPATFIASQELGNRVVANVVMLGAMVELASIVSVNALRNAIAENVPKGTEEINLKAFERGREIAKRLKLEI
jgi:2-oxoglutarate ferredoxin oxidoreductase subunit gamma